MKTKAGLILILVFFVLASAAQNKIVIGKIKIEGNKKTKAPIILRELMFAPDSVFTPSQWIKVKEKSRENLINTSLFHTAGISLQHREKDTADVLIKIVERWYLWPIPQVDIYERNFNVWWQTKSLERLSAGVFLTQENFRGRMEKLMLLFMAGYNKQLGIAYDAPYINKAKTFGLGAEVIWSSRHEVNAMTAADKQVYYKDVDNPVRRDLLAAIHFRYRKNYYISHLLQLRYRSFYFSDSLLTNAPAYTWKGIADLPFFGCYYKLKIDHRDYKPYPLKGYYVDFELFSNGWGLLNNSDMVLLDLKTTMRKYFKLAGRIYAAGSFTGKISNHGNEPYVLTNSLGYGRDFVRGYEYYVVDGPAYGVVKTNIKWAMIPKRVLKLNFIKTEKFNTIPYAFYLNIFADAGFVSRSKTVDPSNRLPGTWLYSAGVGIDFSTYYDKVARFEVAVNALGETGFFLHFIAPI
jgi:outer membrane protein assembly factor BamA